jgi:iron complex outermembrane receptor protein
VELREREAATGQLAKVVEFTPGAQVTQSGLYDFNLNTRGFNSSLNRRVPALIDGRDPSVPFLMSNDWPSMSSMSDMASVELVRGPSSALYGTNAFNGILVLTTKQPRYSQGGTVQLTGGELSTMRGDVRWSGGLTDTTFLKAHGSYTQSDDFYRSRNVRPEYTTFCGPGVTFNCLPREAAPIATDEDTLWLAGLRLDQYVGDSFFTLEGGSSSVEGPVIQTGIGRVQVLEAERPWIRANFSHPRFNVLAYRNERDAPDQLALASNRPIILDEENWAGELQGNIEFAGSRGIVIGGASYKEEEIDTRGTLTFRPVGAERQAVYGQVEFAFSPKFKAVAAARWDSADDLEGEELHDDQVSPKVAFVIAPTPDHTIRLSYNEAFQSPNFSEFYLFAPTIVPGTTISALNLSPIENALRPLLGGTSLGFGNIPVLALGNSDLEPEEIKSWEVGYSGIIGGKAFITLDYYQSEIENFVTDLVGNVTAAGRINPNFGAYAPPANLPAPVRGAILGALQANVPAALFALMSNGPNGAPIIALASYTNIGAVDTQGIDLGTNFYFTDDWNLAVNYSWFDFEIQEGDPRIPPAALQLELQPNAPEHSASASLGYSGDRFDASLGYRWVEEFRWSAGVFKGIVPSYDTVDVMANFQVNDNFRLGLNVTNALDEEHFQAFGGDVLGRRALGSVTFTW